MNIKQKGINLFQRLNGILCTDKDKKEVTTSPAQNNFLELASVATSNYGVASVHMSNRHQDEEVSTPNQAESVLKRFLGNDRYKMSMYEDLFSNLDKLDYENIDAHMNNIKLLMSMSVNFPNKVVENGYFYSEEGAVAFDALSNVLSCKSSSRTVSPLGIALENYEPQTVLTLKKRGLLNRDELNNYNRLNRLAKMSDEEYENFQARVDNSILQTGCSFEELSDNLKEQIKPLIKGYVYEYFVENNINRESVVAQLELLDSIKDFPLEFQNYDLQALLQNVDVDNIDSYKSVLKSLENREDITQSSVDSVLELANKNTEEILSELLARKDVPVSKIIEYCSKDADFINGLLSFEDVLEKISNDPYIKTVRAIENSNVDLTPQNTCVTALNPHDIESSSLALVHMTEYEPENGMILSTRDKLQGSRNSVHFTLNHPVISHRGGSWDKKEYAIIMPYDSTVDLNGERKIIEGMPNDLYTNGSVQIPEGAVVIKYNPKLDGGDVIISDCPFVSRAKLIETCVYPHKLVPSVLEKMGYSHLKASGPIGLFGYGKNNGNDIDAALENYSSWKTFCDSQGIKPTRHTGSAGDIAEKVIENVGKLCVNNSWHGGRNNSINYKKELLEYLEIIKPWQDMGYFVSYDIDEMIEIIKGSSTPEQAIDEMKERFGFHPTLKYEMFNDCSFHIPIDLYSTWHNVSDNMQDLKYFIKKETIL